MVAVAEAVEDLRAESAEAPGIVVGLSGGPDSVALLDALARLARRGGIRLAAAHLDHGLRAGSADDAAFCRELCERLGVALRTGVGDVAGRARLERGGVEEAARVERHGFLRKAKEEMGARWVALAHTRDDQAETLLLRLLRGSGALGLAAMRRRSGDLLRPLLGLGREDVRLYLEQRGLAWREDPTNLDPQFLRNRVRTELLPYLEARFTPAIRRTLARTAALLADEVDALRDEAERLLPRLLRPSGRGLALERKVLAALPAALGREVLRRGLARVGGLKGVSFAHVEQLRALAAGPSGRAISLPSGRVARASFDELRLAQRAPDQPAFVYPLPVPGSVELPDGRRLEVRHAGPEATPAGVSFAAREVEALVVRTRLPGDRIRWRGREMSLKRFLMEHKVPADERAGLPVVASGPRVLWVAGYGVFDRTEGRRLELRLLPLRRKPNHRALSTRRIDSREGAVTKGAPPRTRR